MIAYKRCQPKDIADLCVRFHYKHKMPPFAFACYVAYDDEVIMGDPRKGCIVYTLHNIWNPKYLQFARLWMCDTQPTNSESKFIAWTIADVRKKAIGAGYIGIVSYADPEAGHEGIVYQASNFIRDGKGRKSTTWHSAKGFVHDKTATKEQRQVMDKQEHEQKHRYVYLFDRRVHNAKLKVAS